MLKLIAILTLTVASVTALSEEQTPHYNEHYLCKGEVKSAELWTNQEQGLLRIKTNSIDIDMKVNAEASAKYPRHQWFDQVSGSQFEGGGPLPLDITTSAGLGSGMTELRPILQIYSPTMGIEMMSCTMKENTAFRPEPGGVYGGLEGKKYCGQAKDKVYKIEFEHCVDFKDGMMVDNIDIMHTGTGSYLYEVNGEFIWTAATPMSLSEYRYRGDKLVIVHVDGDEQTEVGHLDLKK